MKDCRPYLDRDLDYIIWAAILLVAMLFLYILFSTPADARQTQPDAKRVRQIQAALIEHGYAPGKTWKETQEICRHIADIRRWQINHTPDARVLILLGLGNEHSDPYPAEQMGNHLDRAVRGEE
jgi:hypothetical protein